MLNEERGHRPVDFGYDFADYTVYDLDYEKIGKVDDVFVDENDHPRYIGVKMGFLSSRSVLIPVELARVNDRRGLVEVAAGKDAVKEGPTFSDDREITPEFERRVLNYYGVEDYVVKTIPARAGRETYQASYPKNIGNEWANLWPGERAGAAHEHFGVEHSSAARGVTPERGNDDPTDEDELRVQRVEEELRAGTREREAGSIRVRKRVRTDREQVRAPKKRQEVRVERVSVEEGMGTSEPEIVDDEIRVPVIEEEIVVERRPVVKEVLRLRKEVVEDEELIEEYVRKEEVDVDDRTERGGSIRNDRHWETEMARPLHRQTRDKRRPEERRQRDTNTDRNKGTSEKAREEGPPVRSYNYLTVAEAKKKLGGLSQGELKKIRSYEKKHKNRKTLVEWLDRKIKGIS
ncbi:MAG: PRC and DUF2382 domain-containing protein [Actinomycetota bacterium]|nr:PRC and DUF2382 domain-containing protein [Actinomycetota bacterium]